VTHYEVLGVPMHATADEIRQAYRRRARDHHPDTNPADPDAAGERFRQAALAYQVLSDPGRRADYDASLRRRVADDTPPPGGPAPTTAAGTSRDGRRWPRAQWPTGSGPWVPEVTDRIVQVIFMLPLLVVPGLDFLGRVVLVVVGWFAAGYLLGRHAAATPRDWPWWRSPGWIGGGRLLRVAAVAAAVVVAGLVLRPVVDRGEEAIDAQRAVEDAVTAQARAAEQGQLPPVAPAAGGGIGAAIDRRNEAVDDLIATWGRVPVAVAIVAGAWVGSARLPGVFGFKDRRTRARGTR
jgi:DnaJ domain